MKLGAQRRRLGAIKMQRAVTSRNAALGYSRIRTKCPIGARVPSGFSTLVMMRRVISMVTSG
jgi:hypothetical protein